MELTDYFHITAIERRKIFHLCFNVYFGAVIPFIPPLTFGEKIGLDISNLLRWDPNNGDLIEEVSSYKFYYDPLGFNDFFFRSLHEINGNYIIRTQIYEAGDPEFNEIFEGNLPEYNPFPRYLVSYPFYAEIKFRLIPKSKLSIIIRIPSILFGK